MDTFSHIHSTQTHTELYIYIYISHTHTLSLIRGTFHPRKLLSMITWGLFTSAASPQHGIQHSQREQLPSSLAKSEDAQTDVAGGGLLQNGKRAQNQQWLAKWPAAPERVLTQRARRGILMPRGKNCRETIFAAQLPHNYPHHGGNFERGENVLYCGGEAIWEAF